jgi:DNA-binding GntR family transcriptional regulator
MVELKELKKIEHRFDADDKLIKFSRLYLGNEHKVAFLDNYLSIKHFPGMENINYTYFQIYPYIFENYPGTYDIKRQFTIESINKEVANLLSLAEGSPAIHIISQIYTEDGSQVEYSNIWVSAHFFKFQISKDFSL